MTATADATPTAAFPTAVASLRRTLRLVRPGGARLVLAIALGAACVLSAVGLLATSGWLISRASQHPTVTGLGLAIVGVRFFALSRGLTRYGERLVGHDAALRSLGTVRGRVYAQLERLAPSGLTGWHRGDLLARLVADVDALQDLALRVIPPWAVAVLAGTVVVAVTAWILPAAAVVLGVALLAAATVVPWLCEALAKRAEARRAEARGALTTSVVELVEGADELHAFGATGRQLDRIAERDAVLGDVTAAAARSAGIGAALGVALTGSAVWGCALVGVMAVRAGRLDGVLLAVVVLTPLAAFELVGGLPAAAQAAERVRRSATRVLEVVERPDPVRDPEVAATLPPGPHGLVLQGVRARYGPDGPLVLDGVDLELTPGRRVALVGASGAGKSTLAAVMARFLPYEGGSVRLGGIELRDLDGSAVRRAVVLAEQDAHVFHTTIGANLRLGRPDATDDELHAVLERLRLDRWVDSLPRGLRTAVGEHGHRLSGGQRQRLTLARALLADPAILVVDEPAAHVDGPTADAVTADLLSATEGRTTLVITHRLAGLEALDEVVVLDRGRVVERGSPGALVAAGGRFAEMSSSQRWPGRIEREALR